MTQSDEPIRIVISTEDLQTEEVSHRVQEMAQAQQVALVREVGAPAQSSGTTRSILTLTAGGAVGGLLAFGANRFLLTNLELFADNTFLNNLSFTFILAVFIGAGVSLADVITDRNWGKLGRVAAIALPAAVGAALVLGLIAHLVYSAGQDWIFNQAYDQVDAGTITTDQEFEDFYLLRNHLVRGLAWMLVGVAAGVAAGAASRSWKRLGLAAAGGAVGGFLGGFIFDFIPGEAAAQVIGIVLLGLLIGLATAIVEQARKSRWIEIVSGGLAGKQFILYKSTVTLGSAPTADITLIKDSSIAPIAAMMSSRGSQCQIEATGGTVVVNGSQVQAIRLSDSDIVTIGSTQLRFRERASAAKVPGKLQA